MNKETKMQVNLLRYTPDGERLIASAGRLCYSKIGTLDIEKNMSEKTVERMINIFTETGHGSPLEHISFTFAIEGVSRSLTHQLVRHRIASFSQQSQRYVEEDQFDFVIPEEIGKIPAAKEVYVDLMSEIQSAYDELKELLRENGRDSKQSIEDARYVLPNGAETKIVVTMNARTLMHFCNLRCCERAQKEIRDLATEMLRLAKGVYPKLFKKAGPSCIAGACPEADMTCGKIKEVREKFADL